MGTGKAGGDKSSDILSNGWPHKLFFNKCVCVMASWRQLNLEDPTVGLESKLDEE